MIRRFDPRSTHAPAGRPRTSQGNQIAAVRTPIQVAVASKAVAPSTGIRTRVVIDPSTLITSPNQSRRNAPFRAGGGGIVAAQTAGVAVTAGSGSLA